MLKSIFAAGALLAAAASVTGVEFSASGVSVAGKPVTEATLQLREADGGTVLASRERIESLSGIVEVSIGGGRAIRIEPGVRLGRSGDGWEISAHESRRVELTSEGGSVIVSTPARVSPAEGAWTLDGGAKLEGTSLQAGLASDPGVQRVAGDVPPDGPFDDVLLTPAEKRARKKLLTEKRLRTRRVYFDNVFPAAEAADEQALKRVTDVSPAGF